MPQRTLAFLFGRVPDHVGSHLVGHGTFHKYRLRLGYLSLAVTSHDELDRAADMLLSCVGSSFKKSFE